jgi:hypothetical protein
MTRRHEVLERLGRRLGLPQRNARCFPLVVDEAQRIPPPPAVDTLTGRTCGAPRRQKALPAPPLFVDALRSHHLIDAELVRDVADDQE